MNNEDLLRIEFERKFYIAEMNRQWRPGTFGDAISDRSKNESILFAFERSEADPDAYQWTTLQQEWVVCKRLNMSEHKSFTQRLAELQGPQPEDEWAYDENGVLCATHLIECGGALDPSQVLILYEQYARLLIKSNDAEQVSGQENTLSATL